MTFHACDADSTGVERAVAVVYTRRGPVEMCAHHFTQHSDAFQERDYLASVLAVPDGLMPSLNGVAVHGVPTVELFTNPSVHVRT